MQLGLLGLYNCLFYLIQILLKVRGSPGSGSRLLVGFDIWGCQLKEFVEF